MRKFEAWDTTGGGGVSLYSCALAVESIVCRSNELVAGSGQLGVGDFCALESAGKVGSEGRSVSLLLRHAQTKALEGHCG